MCQEFEKYTSYLNEIKYTYILRQTQLSYINLNCGD